MKHISLFITFLLIGCGNMEREKVEMIKDDKFVWIEICGKNNKKENWYNYGKIKMSAYEKIDISGKMPELIRIFDYHWYSDGIMLYEDDLKTGEALIKTYDIERISVILDQDIVKLREKYKAAEIKRQEKNRKEDKNAIP